MASQSGPPSALPACTDFSSVANPSAYCAPCYFHADSTIHSFPHALETLDIDVIPFVTTMSGGARSTSYSTLAPPSSNMGGITFTASSQLTWIVDGITLTAPTTYVDYDDMYGTGVSTAVADGTTYCADPRRAKELRTPSPIDKASVIFPLSAVETAIANKSVPVPVQDYLEGLAWFERQMNSNQISTCLPTTAEFVTTITCTIDPVSELPIPLTTTTCFATTASGSAVNTCETGVYGFTLTPLSTILPATTTSIPILTSLTESPYPTTVDTKSRATSVNYQTRSPEQVPMQSRSSSATETIEPATPSSSGPVTVNATASANSIPISTIVSSSSYVVAGKTTVDLEVSGPAATISGTVYTAVPSPTTGVGSYIMCGMTTCPNNSSVVAPASSSAYSVPPAQGGTTRSTKMSCVLRLAATIIGILAVIL